MIADNVKKVGLLVAKFTMEQDLYKSRLQDMFGIEVLVPNEQQQNVIHNIVYQSFV